MKILSFFVTFLIVVSISTQVCFADMGSIRGKVVVPDGSSEGVILFFFADAEMEYMVDGLVIYSSEGDFSIDLPPGSYYIQAQLDVNKNGQTDPGDLIFTYGGDTPQAVMLGSSIIFTLGEAGDDPINNNADISALPDSNSNGSYSYSGSSPEDSSGVGNIKGKVVVPGKSPVGVLLLVFKDKAFEILVTAHEITSPDGTFNITTGRGEYYLQAFYDATGNGQIDQGDISTCYGGEEPEEVPFDEEILIVFDELHEEGPSTDETPSVAPQATPTPMSGNFRVRVVYPDNSPVGTIVQVSSDSDFKTVVQEVLVELESGSVAFDLPEGSYYVRAFNDLNSNKTIDKGEYGDAYLKPVETGNKEVILVFEEQGNSSVIPDVIPTGTPGATSDNSGSLPPDVVSITSQNNDSNPSLPVDIGMTDINSNSGEKPEETPEAGETSAKGILEGQVLFHGEEYSTVNIFVFSDKDFMNFVASIPVAEDGTFQKELPDKDYYLQAIVDVNENQILEVDDIITTYVEPDNPVPKVARPGGEKVIIIIADKPETNEVSDGGDNGNSGIVAPPSNKEYAIKGNVIWPDHALSKGVVEAYSDPTFRTLKGRAIIDEAGGHFELKVPRGKYFLSVVMDDNMDGQLGLGDGVGIYGMDSISEGKGEMEPVVVSGEKEIVRVNIEITDFVNHTGQMVSLDDYDPEQYEASSGISESFTEYINKIAGYEEVLDKLKLSGKIYFACDGNICIYDLNSHCQRILQGGSNPAASVFSDKLAYLDAAGNIILKTTSTGDKKLLANASDKIIHSISISPAGNYLAYQSGTEITIIDLNGGEKQKKVFTTDIASGPFYISWLPGEKQLACLRGAGRKDIKSAYSAEPSNSAGTGNNSVATDSVLPFDGFSLSGSSGNNSNQTKNPDTDGLFPVVMTSLQEGSQMGAGAFIWNRESMDSYYVDFREAGSISDMVWSPTNPNLFLFTTGIPSQIWLGRLGDEGIEKSQVSIYGGHSPSWSPDGRNIVYINNHQLWIVNMDSGMETPLLNGVLPVYGENPCWCK